MMSAEPSLKRRRVAHACDSCRILKAKCDGQRPICGRCVGYGYTCQWNDPIPRKNTTDSSRTRLDALSASDEVRKLREAVSTYEKLLRGVRNNLSEGDRKVVDLGLSAIPGRYSKDTKSSLNDSPSSSNGLAADQDAPSSQRYLGEASDIRFFHAMKQALSLSGSPEGRTTISQPHADSYEQEEVSQDDNSDQDNAFIPLRGAANNFIDIYFTTIHIAYPFIWQPAFLQKYENFWSGKPEELPASSLSILLSVFAIGACYETFAGSMDNKSPKKASNHQQYFEQAIRLSQQAQDKRNIQYICALLAQCFYLLATCQTDRCWITLGNAIRIAQAVGLHVEDSQRSTMDIADVIAQEERRRTWYSLYVLDRLVALQLGRPPGIHDDDFHVVLPSIRSEIEIAKISPNNVKDTTASPAPLVGDYFLIMIEFSRLIGRVFSGLYGPKKAPTAEATLTAIDRLDNELLQWRAALPRALRFDLAHTFDSSILFKRQRNNLAIKFYNLRALIHRPLLSPNRFLQSHQETSFPQSERPRIQASKRKCVAAAQQTAKLLHNIEDKKSLVYGFPWWQMISCLICASSILLVASICMELDGESADDIDWTAVDEDANVCLTVFDALSANSNAARLARDMMQGLRETRTRSHGQPGLLASEPSQAPAISAPMPQYNTGYLPMMSPQGDLSAMAQLQNNVLQDPRVGMDQSAFDMMFQVPYEVSDPVMWSAQFVDAAYNPFLGRHFTEFDG